jgi:hypothetical protein
MTILNPPYTLCFKPVESISRRRAQLHYLANILLLHEDVMSEKAQFAVCQGSAETQLKTLL